MLTLSVALSSMPVSATTVVPVPPLALAPSDVAPASVLGIDSKDSETASSLTQALRAAFANRGMSGGEEISLQEMRLTMGCTNDSVACLAEGGKTLGVQRLIFGYLIQQNGAYQLDIQILVVDEGTLEAQASIPLTSDDLRADTVDQTATRIVNTLMAVNTEDAELPPRPSPLPTVDEPEPEPQLEPERDVKRERERTSQWYFGFDSTGPRWKRIVFGSTLGVGLAAGGLATVAGIWLSRGGKQNPDGSLKYSIEDLKDMRFGFRQRLVKDALDSLENEREVNRVSPYQDPKINLCRYNDSELDEDGNVIGPLMGVDPDGNLIEGGIRDRDVEKTCKRGDMVRKGFPIVVAIGGVMGLAALATLGTMLIHRRQSPLGEAMRRHDVRFGLSPQWEGGMSLSGGFRF